MLKINVCIHVHRTFILFILQHNNSPLIEDWELKSGDLAWVSQSKHKNVHLESLILALTGEPFHKNPFAVLCNTCTQKAASRAPFSRKAGSDSRRVSCNFPLCEMKRKHPPPPPPRPTPSSKRKEGNGERNGLIKRKEGEDYEEDWEMRGEREDKSAIAELPAKTGMIFKAKARIKLTSWGGSVCLFMAPLFFFHLMF